MSGPAYAAVLVGSAVADVVAANVVWRRRGSTGRNSLCVVLLAAAAWSLAYALELAAPSSSTVRVIGGDLQYVGTTVLPPAWLIFALQFTGRVARVGPRLLGALAVEPLVVLSFLACTPTRALIQSYPPGPPQPIPIPRLGVGYWLHFAYTNVLVLIGSAILLSTMLRTSRLYWRQGITLLIAISLPLLGNAMSSLDVPPFQELDPTPVAVALGAWVLLIGVFRYQLLDLRPVALRLVMETIRDAVFVVDARNRLIDLNPAAQQLLGRKPSTAIGRSVEMLLPEQAATMSNADPGTYDLRFGVNGSDRDLEVTITPLADPPLDAGRVLMFHDVSAHRELERNLRRLAYTDSLTGLPNRALFHDRLAQALATAARHRTSLAILFLDLDRFKIINDSLGHEIGDRILVAVGHRLRDCLRAEDTIARLGGDEFAVLLPEISASQDTRHVANKLLNVLTAPQLINGHELTVDASIGVALFPEDGTDGRRLMRRADAAMYSAKARGGGRVETFAPALGKKAKRRQQLEVELRRGLRTGQLRLLFQPYIELSSGRVVGYEALVRWDHPRYGLLCPARFLPLAEDTGLIEAVDRWVLDEACREARRWAPPFAVSVNVSPAQLRGGDLAQHVTDILSQTGLNPTRLTLELNERTLFDEPETLALIEDVADAGVNLALDDFGAGYTSLGHLRRLPLTELKIDRSLVLALDHDGHDVPIVAALISFAHTLGLCVTAEGIERPQQLKRLRGLGCEYGQGFLLGRPHPIPSPASR
ncbi:MAG: putative bifunctional diguanylate cyclase/phosphodiesterase [Frankiaceae bacterium]